MIKLDELLSQLAEKGIRLDCKSDSQLSVRGNKTQLDDGLLEQLQQNKAELIAWIKSNKIQKSDLSKPIAASKQQVAIYQHSKSLENKTAYNLTTALLFNHNIDCQRLQQAVNDAIEAHPALKTSFAEKEGILMQQYQPHYRCAIEQSISTDSIDLTLEQETPWLNQSFDITNELLLRLKLVSVGHQQLLLLSCHHLITDARSNQVIIDDIFKAYQGETLTTEALNYFDYSAQLQQQQAEPLDLSKAQAFNFIQQKRKSRAATIQTIDLEQNLASKISTLSKQQKISNYSIYLTALALVLRQYGNNTQFAISAADANRNDSRFIDSTGLFVSLAPLYFDLTHDTDLNTLCQKSFAFANTQSLLFQQSIQQIPFLQDVVISYYHERLDQQQPEVPYQTLEIMQELTRFPIQLSIVDGPNPSIELAIGPEVKDGVFDAFRQHYIEALNAIILNTQTTDSFSVLNHNEQQAIWALGHGISSTIKDKNIIEQFIAASHKHPNNTALKTNEQTLSYRELEQQSAQLANWIAQEYGSNHCIAISLERSFELIICMLAILRSGNSYLPLDSNLPLSRKENIVCDANCIFAFSENAIHQKTVSPESIPSLSSSFTQKHDNFASAFNVMYTSGSTGEPKGVIVGELALRNRLQWMQELLNVNSDDVFLQKTSISFDVSVWEIFLPLISGARILLLTAFGEKDPEEINHIIEAEKISICHFVPSALENQLKSDNSTLPLLKTIVLSGEKLTAHNAKNLLHHCPNTQAFNLYGPTEAAIDVSFHKIEAQSLEYSSVPIGKPINNVQLYILDNDKKTTPKHCVGELYIGGVALAEAYINKAELSSAAFIDNPFFLEGEPSIKLYKTGDYCYLNTQGDIVFENRIDQQVKIRGQRFELKEIEHSSHIALPIDSARCLYHQQQLILFYQSKHLLDKKLALAALSEHLPDFALPSTFIATESWPVNHQGKLDRSKLLVLALEDNAIQLSYSELLNSIHHIWKNLFEQPLVTSDDFFALGGHSLLALKFLSQLYQETGLDISLEALYQYSTIETLAEYLSTHVLNNTELQASIKNIVSKQQKLLLTFQEIHPQAFNYNLSGAFHIYGELHIKLLEQAIKQLLKTHPVLSSTFRLDHNKAIATIIDNDHWLIDYAEMSENLIESSLKSEFTKPFNLNDEIPLRATLYKLDEKHFVFSFVIHHIACDAWSLHLLYQEIFTTYEALLNGQQAHRLQQATYQQYASAQQNQPEQLHLEYWLEQLQTAKAVTLTRDYPPETQQRFSGQQLNHSFSGELSENILTFCQKNSLTPFIFCLSIYQLLLSKLSHQQDISIALALSGRNNARFFDAIGYFVNTVIVRSRPLKELRIDQYLQQQKNLITDVLAHQTVDSEKLFDQLTHSNAEAYQLGNYGFNFLEYSELFKLDDLSPLKIEPINIEPGISKLDMSWLFSLNENQLTLSIEFNDHCFKKQTIQQYLDYFQQLCQFVIDNSESYIADCYCLAPKSIDQIINKKSANTESYYPLTPIQKDLYVDSLINRKQQNHTGFYTVSDADADLDVWQQSIRQLYNKTDLLRTVIRQSDEPLLEFAYQVVQKPSEDIFRHCQQVIYDTDTSLSDAVVNTITDTDLKKPFDDQYPLWRATTYSFKEGMKLFIFTSHHALFDGVNTQLIGSAIKENYHRLIDQQPLLFPVNNYPQYAHRDTIEIDQEKHLSYWEKQNDSLTRFLNFSALTQTENTSINEAFYQSGDKTLEQLQLFCKKSRTTLAHFYKALFALTIRHYHALEKPFAFVEVSAGRSSDEYFVPGLMFDQQINVIDQNLLEVDTVKSWLGKTAKLRKSIKANGRLSLARQQAIFSEKIDYIYNFYIMQSETEFLGSKEKIGHLIPRIEGKQNLVVSLVDSQLRLQFFYPEHKIDGDAFLQLLLKLQQEILEGTENLNQLNITEDSTDSFFYLDGDTKPESGQFYPLSNQGNGEPWQLVNPWHKACLNTAGTLVKLNSNNASSSKAIIHGNQLYVFPEIKNNDTTKLTLPARNTVESLLTETWQNVLGIECIDIHDNFFSLGGHSLHAMRIANQLQEQLGVTLAIHQVFKNPTIAGISQIIFQQSLQHSELPAIASIDKSGKHPISPSQQRLWLLHKTSQLTNEYNILAQIRIQGNLDLEKMRAAHEQLLDKHPALRLSLKADGLSVHQEVLDKKYFELTYTPLTQYHKNKLNEHQQHVFILDDLQPLFLSSLYQTDNNEYLLSFCIHHLICDAQSLHIMAKDLLAFYKGIAVQQTHAIDFIDYCHWQEQLHNNTQLTQATDYWLKYLNDVPIELGLKNDYPRKELTTLEAQQINCTVDSKLLSEIDSFCQEHGISRYILLLFTYHITLAKHSGNRDIAIGISRDGRFDHSLSHSVGFFINALIIRFIFDKNLGLKDAINQFSEQLLNCYQYEYLHVEHVIRKLKLPRSLNIFPIVQAAFNYIDTELQADSFEFDGLNFELLNNNNPTARFELVLSSFIDNQNLQLIFEYQQSLFAAETIQCIADDYTHILQGIVCHEPTSLYQLLDSPSLAYSLEDDIPETIEYWQQLLRHKEPLYSAQNLTSSELTTINITLNNAKEQQPIIIAAFTFLLQQYFDQGDSFIIHSPQNFYLQQVISGVSDEALKHQQQCQSPQLNYQLLSHYQQQKLFHHLPVVHLNQAGDLSINIHKNRVTITQPSCIKITRIEERLTSILNQIRHSYSIHDISLLLDDEQPHSEPVSIAATSLIDGVYQQCKAQGDKPAINVGADSCSYNQLSHYSHAIAAAIRNLGIERQSKIAILLPYSIPYLPTLLAITHTACIYIPIDLQLPKDRINYLLEDCQAELVISQKNILDDIPYSGKTLLVDNIDFNTSESIPIERAKNNDLIYLMYTSGSTGLPKACAIYRHSFEHLLNWYTATFDFNENTQSLIFSSPGFDLTQKNFFATLLSGGTLQLTKTAYYDPALITRTIKNNNISHINCAPSAFYPLLESNSLDTLHSLKQILLGGEAIESSRIKPWLNHKKNQSQLVNMYGPTECTDISSYDIISDTEDISLGKAIDGVNLHVQNSRGYLLPAGFTGELLIGGVGVAHGYVNMPELTAEKFMFHQTLDQTLYRSGDKVIFHNDKYYYQGRIDQQLKINGIRIEPQEIEHAIKQLTGVKQAMLINVQNKLIAFALSDYTNIEQWQENLQRSLTPAMLPNQLITVSQWPLTANGKIDQQALLTLTDKQTTSLISESETENILAELWVQVLGQTPQSIHSNFFSEGGDSLSALRLLRLIENSFGVKVAVTRLYHAQTITSQARLIEQHKQPFNPLVELKSGNSHSPIFMVHDITGLSLNLRRLSDGISTPQQVYALTAYGFETEQTAFNAMDELIEFYCTAITEQQSTGAYHIVGYSFGGIIAIEIARKLKALGKQVRYIGLIDSWLPKHSIIDINPNDIRQQFEGLLPKSQIEQAIKVQQGFYQILRNYKAEPLDSPLYLYKAQKADTSWNNLLLTFANFTEKTRGFYKISNKITVLEFDSTHSTILNNTDLQKQIDNDLSNKD